MDLLIVVLIVVWLTGAGLAIGGNTIHLLGVIVLVLVAVRLVQGRELR